MAGRVRCVADCRRRRRGVARRLRRAGASSRRPGALLELAWSCRGPDARPRRRACRSLGRRLRTRSPPSRRALVQFSCSSRRAVVEVSCSSRRAVVEVSCSSRRAWRGSTRSAASAAARLATPSAPGREAAGAWLHGARDDARRSRPRGRVLGPLARVDARLDIRPVDALRLQVERLLTQERARRSRLLRLRLCLH